MEDSCSGKLCLEAREAVVMLHDESEDVCTRVQVYGESLESVERIFVDGLEVLDKVSHEQNCTALGVSGSSSCSSSGSRCHGVGAGQVGLGLRVYSEAA